MFRIFDIVAFSLERIRQHLVLVFWVLLGITIAVTLALSLPLYVDSVYSGILESELIAANTTPNTTIAPPPYGYKFRYLSSLDGNVTIADTLAANAAIEEQFAATINLPVQQAVRLISGGSWGARLVENRVNVGNFSLSTLTGSDHLMQITAGEWSNEMTIDDEGRVPLLLPESMLFNNGIQVGDEILMQRRGGDTITAYVAAMWRPINEDDPFWIYPSQFFDQRFLVTQETLLTLLENIENPIDELGWYLVFDGSSVRTASVDTLLSNSQSGQRTVELALPGTRVNLSPIQGLISFKEKVDSLTQQLFIIVLPVGGLILYFISLVAGLLVTRQQAEDVKLRSRGMSRASVLTIHVLMWSFIVGMALGLAVILSPFLVRLIGRTASFLDFTGVSSVQDVILTRQAITIALITGIVAASSGLILAWRITRQNINSLKRVSRASTQAWWQRAYLDLAMVVLACYVLYTLATGSGIQSSDNPFGNPLTFLAPTLFALGLTLLFLRLLPIVLALLARFIGVTSNIPILMALRELTRNIGGYRGTLIMTVFTLSLVGFTASMASTLDQSLLDVVRYQVGAELVVVTIPDTQTKAERDSSSGQVRQEVTGYNAPPVQQLLDLPEVDYLSRVGKYPARLSIASRRIEGLAVGIDRAGLGGVAYVRNDYSALPLGTMLNELASNRTGVILSRQVAESNNILIGQEVRYQVQALGAWQSEMRATVIGFIDYFPTVDPADYDFYLVTSLQPIFEVSGTPLPFNIWLKLSQDSTLDTAQEAIRAIDFPVLRFEEPQSRLEASQAQPSRRGVLGFLSVGFVASIVLTLIGSMIQSIASFSAQSSQLGSLRAMGLSGFSLRLYILTLQGLIAITGVGSGTLIGVGTTLLFLPLLDFSGGLPPYQVRVAWDEIATVYLVFGAILFVVAILLSLVLSRQQLSRVVKLGSI